jgi:hypothetical protein
MSGISGASTISAFSIRPNCPGTMSKRQAAIGEFSAEIGAWTLATRGWTALQ